MFDSKTNYENPRAKESRFINYSAAVSNMDLDNKLNELSSTLSTKLEESMNNAFCSFKTTMTESIANLSQTINKNNEKIGFFTVDAIKACLPNLVFDKQKIDAVESSFKRHNLGQLDNKSLTTYCNKLNAKHST